MSTTPALLQRFRSRELNIALTALKRTKTSPGTTITPASTADSTSTAHPTVSIRNPFLPTQNPHTKRWREPVYSLRRQAELIKAAKNAGPHGVKMLPPGLKLHGGLVEIIEKGAKRGTEVEEQEAKARAVAGWGVVEEVKDSTTTTTTTSTDTQPSKATKRGRTKAKRVFTPQTTAHFLPHRFNTLTSPLLVSWVGLPKVKPVPGADFGARLYAGKKRMFKGHKWEREHRKRQGQIKVRLRDMQERIRRFKWVYQRRRPDPLKPPRVGKKNKIPF